MRMNTVKSKTAGVETIFFKAMYVLMISKTLLQPPSR